MSDGLKSDIRAWWAGSPMTYGDTHGHSEYRHPDGTVEVVQLGSRRFFDLADETFYSWNEPLHRGNRRFAAIFDYERHQGRRVLEVGCGVGCMAMNWARNGARVTAVYTALTRAEWALERVAGGEGALVSKYRHPAVAPHLRALQRQFPQLEALLAEG